MSEPSDSDEKENNDRLIRDKIGCSSQFSSKLGEIVKISRFCHFYAVRRSTTSTSKRSAPPTRAASSTARRADHRRAASTILGLASARTHTAPECRESSRITSITTLTVLSFERYMMVSRPLTARRLDARGAVLSVVFIWSYSLALTAPPLLGWGKYVSEAANIRDKLRTLTTECERERYSPRSVVALCALIDHRSRDLTRLRRLNLSG
ncbi:Pineal opsin [Eumeta japonica]|uniref:Pineal opsin n=1 Tax=Eumeta variegata TaxID=151549 RepID=A0A4C1XQ40_EUMVA|nr:Pineal opsin [Eumeta japonica]